jgi:hypothetical protein
VQRAERLGRVHVRRGVAPRRAAAITLQDSGKEAYGQVSK